jgi:hypothetical protein
LHDAVARAGDEERPLVWRNTKTPRVKIRKRQRIKALQSWSVSKTNENSVETQDENEIVVELQRIELTSLFIRTETFRFFPCWSRRRQVELGETIRRHHEIDEELIADDDQCVSAVIS